MTTSFQFPAPVPGKSHGQRSLVDYSPWGCKDLDMTECTHTHTHTHTHATTKSFTVRSDYTWIFYKRGLRTQLCNSPISNSYSEVTAGIWMFDPPLPPLVLSTTLSSVQFSHSVVSDSLRPHESQHARPPCPSPTPGVHSDSSPSSQWCHPAISSSVVPPSIIASLIYKGKKSQVKASSLSTFTGNMMPRRN